MMFSECLKRLISKGQRQTFLRYFRALLYLFNVHTLLLAGMGCLAVYACDRWKLQFSMDFTLVATGTTFPLVFTIQQSFTRREKALSLIANLKASVVGLYFMHRDWCQDESFPASMGNDHNTAALQCKLLLLDLMRDVREYLVAESQYESYAEQRLAAKRHECANLLLADMSLSGASQLSFAVALEKAEKEDPAAAALRRCYRCFSRLSVLNERLGLRAGYTKGGEGGMSRTNQYLRYIISGLEELRYIKEYRTPIMMRAAHGVLLHLFAIVLAPYFVHFCDSWTALGYERASCPAGYTASIVYCLITMLLFNTQQDLENPFDMCGMDDVFFDLGYELDDVIQPMASLAVTPSRSGCASPRHLTCAQDMCGGGVYCPGSPNPRTHADLSWPLPPPWAQQKGGAAVASISRRGSTLGTVTEEDGLVGVECNAQSRSASPTAGADKASATGMGGTAAVTQPDSSDGRTKPSTDSQHSQVNAAMQQLPTGNDCSRSSHGSPEANRPASAAVANAACQQNQLHMRQQSPRSNKQEQQQQLRQQQTIANGPLQDLELVSQAGQLLSRSSSDGGSAQGSVMGTSARSSSDASLGDDSSTQLIRVGMCRSDDNGA